MLSSFSQAAPVTPSARARRRRHDRRGAAGSRRRDLLPWIDRLEDRTVLSNYVWTGAVSGAWGTAGNWLVGGTVPASAPKAGDNLDFPASGVTNFGTNNNITAGTAFGSVEIDATGYTFAGNPLGIGGGMSTTFASGAQQWGIPTTATASEAFNVKAGGTLDFNTSGTLGSGAGVTITKAQGGTLQLDGNNTALNGTLSITAGNVVATNDNHALGSAHAITVNSGAELDLQSGLTGISIPSTVTLSMAGGATLGNLGGSNTFAGNVTLTGNASVNTASGSQLTLSGAIGDGGGGFGLAQGGGGTLVLGGTANNTYTGLTSVANGTLQLNKPAGSNAAVPGNLTIGDGTHSATVQDLANSQIVNTSLVTINGSGAKLDLHGFQEGIGSLVFNGGGSVATGGGNYFRVNNAGPSPQITVNGAGAIASITGTGTFDLVGADRTINVSDAAAVLDISTAVNDSLAGAHGIIKQGAGTLQLDGSNTFTGNTQVQAGTVEVTNSNALGSGTTASTTTVSAGATLSLYSNASPGIALPAGIRLNLAGTGVGNLGALRNLNGSNAVTDNITLTGAGSAPVDIGTDAGALDLIGNIGSAAAPNNPNLTKIGTGTLQLDGNSTYTGGTTVAGGTVVATANHALGTAGVTVQNGTSLGMSSNAGIVVPNAVSVQGTGASSGTPALYSTGTGTNEFAGNVTLAGPTTVGAAMNGALQFSAGAGTGIIAQGPYNLTVSNGTGTGADGITRLSGGSANTSAGGNVIVNSGVLSLGKSGSNILAFHGDLTIGDGTHNASVRFSSAAGTSDNQIDSNTNVTLVGSGAQLQMLTHTDTINALAFTGGTVNTGTGPGLALNNGGITTNGATSTATIAGTANLTLGSVARPVVVAAGHVPSSGPDLEISAPIGSSGGIQKSGAGVLQLDHDNSGAYTGPTTISGGAVAATVSNALGASALVTVQNTGSLVLAPAGATGITLDNPLSLSGNGMSSGVPAVLSGGGTSTGAVINTLSGPVTLAGNATVGATTYSTLALTSGTSIGGDGFGLTMNVAPATAPGVNGVVDLESSGTYTGPTVVNAGTLRDNGTNENSAVTVNAGATLGGVGVLGPVNVVGGNLAPSNGTSLTPKLTTLPLTLDSNSKYTVQLGKSGTGFTNDLTEVHGNLNLGGATLVASLAPGYTPAAGDSFTIISNQGGSPISGTFANLAPGTIFSIGGKPFQVSYSGGVTGKSVVLTAVHATTTTVTHDVGSPVFGQAVAFTATVTDDTGVTPTGTVTFSDNGSTLGTVNLVGGQAVYTVTAAQPLGAGSHTITATYIPNATFATSSGTDMIAVGAASTTSSVVSSSPSATYGNLVVLTDHVTVVSPGAGVPAGSVQFYSDSSPIGSPVALDASGFASYSISTLNVAGSPHVIHASFVPSTSPQNFVASDSPTINQVVTPRPATVAANPQSVVSGNPIPTLTATVNGAVNGDTLNYTLSTTATPSSPAGNYPIVVALGSNPNYNVTAANSVLSVTQTSPTASVTSFVTAGGSSVFGQSTSFTVQVSPGNPGGATPTGNVVFFVDGVTATAVALNAGRAAFTPSLPVGTHTIQAIYVGGGGYQGSQASPITQTVNQAQTSSILTAFRSGNRIILTGQVGTVAPGAGTAVGAVSFYRANGKLQGTLALNNASASLTLKRSYAKNKTFFVAYSGSTSFARSESARMEVRGNALARSQVATPASFAGRMAAAARDAAARMSNLMMGVLPTFADKKAR